MQSERTRHLWLIFFGLMLAHGSLTMADPDLWGHTLYGARSIELGTLTEKTDPYSFTAAGARWVNHEWLTEYQLGWLWKTAGNSGLCLWKWFWLGLFFAAVSRSFRASDVSLGATYLCLVIGGLALSDFTVFVRPQLTTFALFAIVLTTARSAWQSPARKKVWLLPFLIGFWVNLHGGWLAGIAILGLLTVAAGFDRSSLGYVRRRVFPGVFALSLLATLCNPYGFEMHQMLWEHLATEQFVREWQPLWAVRRSAVFYAPFLLMAMILPFARRMAVTDLLILAAVSTQAILHIRHVALLLITVMVLCAVPATQMLNRLLPRITHKWSRPEFQRLRLYGGVLVLLGVISTQLQTQIELFRSGILPTEIAVETRQYTPGMPLRALQFLKNSHVESRLFTDYGWAQCAIWHLHPRTKIAFDGRYRTVYSQELEKLFIEFQFGEGNVGEGNGFLAHTGTDTVLIPCQSNLVGDMESLPGWSRVYQDEQALIFAKGRVANSLRAYSQSNGFQLKQIPRWVVFPGLQTPGDAVHSEGAELLARD